MKTEIKTKIFIPTSGKISKLMILLHGKTKYDGEFASVDKMISKLCLDELAEVYQLMIVVPYFEKNSYYISTPECCYQEFISKELIAFVEKNYPETKDVEKILAGVSMGGYGAVLIGAHTDVFEHVISISGSFISNDVMIGNPEVWGRVKPNVESTKGTFLSAFLPLEDFMDSKEKNVENAILESSKNTNYYVTCGVQDWLYSRNVKFVERVKEAGLSCEFYVLKGTHNNRCFKEGLWEVLGSGKM